MLTEVKRLVVGPLVNNYPIKVQYAAFGVFLPLIAINCATLGGNSLSVQRSDGFGESIVFGRGSGGGWALAIVALTGSRERLKYNDIPEGLQRSGITSIIMELTAIGCMRSSGRRLESDE